MTTAPMVHALTPDMFGRGESIIAEADGMIASAFRYASGVAGLRIRNRVGEITLLPFQGQQIWDATFFGRRLTMGSMFAEPYPTTDYLRNYGGFVIHCGATAMGNPGPTDTHPLHGELPNARYDTAALVVGSDNGHAFMELTGSYAHRVAFSYGYVAVPVLRMEADSSLLRAEMTIRNTRQAPMDCMYLAHVNFRPVDGARIMDTVPDDARHIKVRSEFPPQFELSPAHRALVDATAREPKLHRDITPGQRIDPELVMTLACAADDDGWTRAMQLLSDGTADFTMHRPEELPAAVRWIARTGDEDAIGLMLPSTAAPNGYAAAKVAGELVSVPPGRAFHCAIVFGALDKAAATEMRGRIEARRASR